MTRSSGQCTEGGLELGQEQAVKEEDDSGQEEGECFDKDRKRENQKIRMREESGL